MNYIAQLVQLIATAVNSRLTMNLSQRIQQLATVMGGNSGKSWVDRTPAGHAVQQQKIAVSNNAVSNAAKNHAQARAETQKAAADFLQEQLNPTGKNLAELGRVAEEAANKFQSAAETLDETRRENDRIKARAISQTHVRQIEKSGESVERATEHRSQIQEKYSTFRQAVTEEETNPTGMDPALLQRMRDAADVYRVQLDQASDRLKNVTSDHERLRSAIDKQIASVQGLSKEDIGDLQSASARTAKATDTRDSIQDKYNTSRDKLTSEIIAPSGMSAKALQKLANTVAKFERDLQKSDSELQKVTAAEAKLQDAILRGSRAEIAAEKRKSGTTFSQRLRKLNTGFRRMIGSRGRKAMKPLTNRLNRWKNVFDQKKAKAFRDKAKTRFNDATSRYKTAQDAHKTNPTAVTKGAADAAGKSVASAASELEAAEGVAALAEVLAPLGEAAAGAAAAIAPLIIAIGAIVTVVAATLAYINGRMAEGKKEVERLRSERSTFSASIANSVVKYDIQSRQLEQRSSQATSGSGTAVAEATMKLRESLQGRSEQWEDIGNKLLATTLDIATFINEGVVKPLDVLTPVVRTLLDGVRATLERWGITLTEIAKNTEKEGPIGFQQLELLLKQNDSSIKRKPQNPRLPPIK